MKVSKTLTTIAAAGMLGAMSLGNLALADASAETQVTAEELQNDIQLHPELSEFGISVVPMEDGTLTIEGMIDDQQAYDALNQMIDEKTQSMDITIENNVVRS